jgi:hypothetical protein
MRKAHKLPGSPIATPGSFRWTPRIGGRLTRPGFSLTIADFCVTILANRGEGSVPVLERLGHVLYWLGWGVAGLLFIYGGIFIITATPNTLGVPPALPGRQ